MRFILYFLFLFFVSESSLAARPFGSLKKSNKLKSEYRKLAREKQKEADILRMQARYVTRDPYIPQTLDYGIELGANWREKNNYWVGMDFGYHLGTCVFSESQTCQNYADIIFGVGGRKSYTHFMALPSLRWQFVNFPSSWSPFARVVGGIDNTNDPEGIRNLPAYGAGVGIATFLHPRVDLRIEIRAIQSEVLNTQVLFSTQLKIDEWIEYFANRIKDVGIGTVSVTGKVVEGAVGVTGTVVETTGKAVDAAAGAVRKAVPGKKSEDEPTKNTDY